MCSSFSFIQSITQLALYSSESCIKGHRSSSCKHTDRPLFEIKKKGRPVSQCEKCRELRQSKRVHSKCLCGTTDDKDGLPKPPPRKKSMLHSYLPSLNYIDQPVLAGGRYIPTTPTLTNGLSDAILVAEGSSTSTASRRRGWTIS